MHNVATEAATPSRSDMSRAAGQRSEYEARRPATGRSRETYIAITALLLISAYMVFRFALHWSERRANVPLFLALVAGIPLLFETRKAKTLFVGDGINDAPSMLAATAGVAMGGTSEAISESADAVILDSSLRKIDELIHIGRRMKKISLESAIGGILLSGAGMAAAAAGHLSPLNGAIAQEIIDLVVVLNALRVTIPTARLADF